MRLRIAGLLLILVAMSLVGIDAYAKLRQSRPIQIDFEQKPLKKINQGNVYTLRMSWRNLDQKRSYRASFVFITTAKGIRADCMIFTFEDITVAPEESTNTLTFTLPKQTFLPSASGVVSVEIVYNRAGRYNWDIGVAQRS